MAGKDAVGGAGHKLPREMNRQQRISTAIMIRLLSPEPTTPKSCPLAPHVFCVTDAPTLKNVIIIVNAHNNKNQRRRWQVR